MLGALRERLVGYYRTRARTEKERLKKRMFELETGRCGWLVDLPSQFLFGSDLRMLATIYLTDKWNAHWYAEHYEELFHKIRHNKINLLEIGVGGCEDPKMGGNSLRMWRTYFPKGLIYGADIYDKSFHDRGRIKTFQGNQVDTEFLDNLASEIGRIDVIIDDGSHLNEHVVFTFSHLFPHLAEGGVYAVEDAQTSYWEEYGGNETNRNDSSTAMAYFKSLTDGLNWQEFRGSYNPTYFDLHIKSIAFYHNLIVVRKGSEGDARSGASGPGPGCRVGGR